jgi:hypothetical protein
MPMGGWEAILQKREQCIDLREVHILGRETQLDARESRLQEKERLLIERERMLDEREVRIPRQLEDEKDLSNRIFQEVQVGPCNLSQNAFLT